jgi:anti-sigma regulatory factor (Ser/Thr protein kinase)
VLSVDLPPEPSSASRARSLARERLTAYPEDTQETIALLVTELVTNAILHARTPMQLTMEAHPDHVRICVEDGSPERPEVRHYDPDSVTGRGLALVEQLASSWGIESNPSGKVVWCEVAVESAPEGARATT